MHLNDPIADMLTRIRNALMRSHSQVVVPHSQIKEAIVKILQSHKFIVSYTIADMPFKNKQIKSLLIQLTGEEAPISPITALKRDSRPGRRVYVSYQQIPLIKNGRGLVIVSTDKGLMTGYQARKQNLGGEVLCSIY